MARHYRLLGKDVTNGNRKWSKRTRQIRHIVLHTAEMLPDRQTPYTGAQRLSEYGASTSRDASWHCQVDSGGVVWQLPENLVANHCVGSNSTSVGVEMVMRAKDWAGETSIWRSALFENLVELVTDWVIRYDIPIERHPVEHWKVITSPGGGKRKVADNTKLPPGIYAHADLDPSRRHDPGKDFPWEEFLEEVTLQLSVRLTKQVRKEIAERKEVNMSVPYLKTEDVDFLQDWLNQLEGVKARPSSLVYVLRFYREVARQLGLPGNQPEQVAGKLVGMPLPDAHPNTTPEDEDEDEYWKVRADDR